MLAITNEVAAAIRSQKRDERLPKLIDLISEFGDESDAQLLYETFHQHKDPRLLEPIMFHGNAAISNDLFAKAIVNGKLDPSYPSEVLPALSYLQNPALAPILIGYYQTLFDGGVDWQFHSNVCQALLNYTCEAYQTEIRAQVEQCLKVHLFNDFIPVLAYKLNDRELDDRLIRHAREVASSSCVAGIILSTALAGAHNRTVFKELIFDKGMEATYAGIGNAYYTFMGMHALKISITELYEDFLIAGAEDHPDFEFQLNRLEDLLSIKLHEPHGYQIRAVDKVEESFTSLYQLFFGWKDKPNVDETIIGVIGNHAKKHPAFREDWQKEKWYHTRNLYELKMQAELLTMVLEKK